MKRNRIYRVAWVLAVGILLASASVAQAGTLYYSGAATYNHGWDQGVTEDWSTSSGGPYNTAYWSDGSDANFTGTAATVTVTGTINSVNSITFSKTNYTLSGGTINLTGAGGNITTGTYTDYINSVLTGTVGLTKVAGTGGLVLLGANTYSGGTTISSGLLQIGNNGTTGTLVAGPVADGGTLMYYRTDSQTWSNSITGTGALEVYAGTLTLSSGADNRTAGSTIIQVQPVAAATTLSISSPIGPGALYIGYNQSGSGWGAPTLQTSGSFTLTNSTIYVGSSFTATGHAPVSATFNVTSGTLTYAGSLVNDGSGTGNNLVKAGPGTLLLSSPSGTNTYSGSTTVSAGTLQVATINLLPGYNSAGSVTVTGGATLAVNYGGATDWTQGNVDTLRTYATFSSGSYLGFDTTNASGGATYGSSITGSPGYGLTKLGSNTLTLSGADTYTGATTVSAGTLYLSGGAISTSSDIQVANGATYQVLVSPATSVSLYSRLATTDPSVNKLNLVGAIINQSVSYTLDSSNVTMQWRARTNTEVSLGLGSDVMTLGGITSGTPYVADMYYNPASLLGPGAPTLAYNPSDSIWVNAVNGNTGNNASGGELGYVGSFAAFQTWVGDTNIADYVGAYGYDPGTDQAWAVVNQAGGSFAVVPEPGTLAMLAVCLLGMVAYGWRKRK